MSASSERIDRLSPAKTALLAVEKMRSRLEELERRNKEPIAVVGMGCRFPGGATEPEAFWQMLRAGRDAVVPIPADRWDVAAFYDRDPQAAGKSYTRHGAYLQDVALFDAAFFGISPREAVQMDPQQRLLLEVSWEALENAGIRPDRLAGTRTGVFVGICNSDYRDSHGGVPDPSQIDAYTGTGNLFSVAAGRVSHVLGLNGPSLAIDTACSSSLVAVHLACQSLRLGECETALAGGVNLILSPFGNVFLSRAQAIAADGRCRTFDAAASGYGRGEGCGVVVLKRLSDATTAGDRLLAIIRGSAVNHDGRSGGLTVPNGVAQQALLRQAMENAGVDAAQVNYVEAHGTGTALGDPIEVGALAAALCQGRPSDQPLIIGSVKTNIGHLESAAGVAGLMKVVLALAHEEIPPHLHLTALSPHISEHAALLTIPEGPLCWPAPRGQRLAGVSAFGLGGTNAHVVVGAAPALAPHAPTPDRPVQVLPLSAKSAKALGDVITSFHRRFDAPPVGDSAPSLAEVAHTAGVGRCHFSERAAVVAATLPEALDGLRSLAAGMGAPGVFRGTGGGRLPSLHFVFGDGSALCPGMGRELYQTHASFRRSVDASAEILQACTGERVSSLTDSGMPRLLDEPQLSSLAALALNCALAELWRSWGIEAAEFVGEGLGEYAAAIGKGVLSMEDGFKLVTDRVKSVEVPAIQASSGAGGEEPEGSLRLHLVPARTCPAGTLSSLGEKGDWAAVAESVAALYTRGFDFDWAAFDRPYPRHRIVLPSYPFQRQRFWKEETKVVPPAAHARARRRNWAPLLGQRLQSPIAEAVFQSSYSVASLPWLDDHKFYGTVIVAGASYLSMALAGASEEFKCADPLLADVAFPQPIILEAGPRSVQLILNPQGPRRADFRIVSADPAESDGDENGSVEWKVHAVGGLHYGDTQRSDVPPASIEGLRQRVREEWSAEQFYRTGRANGMEAGPSFQWVHRIWRAEGEALAEMKTPLVLEEKSFDFHPGLIDSCFQILGVCLPPGVYPPAPGQIPVVARVERFHAVRPPTDRTWAHLRLRTAPATSDGATFDCDFRLYNDGGEVALDVSGLQIRLVSHRDLLRRHHRRARRWAHEIQWSPARRPREVEASWNPEAWIVLSDRQGVGTALAESLRASGHRCLLAYAGEAFASLGGDAYEVDLAESGPFDLLLRTLDPSGKARLGVVHSWSLDLEADEATMLETLERARGVALDSTIKLLRSLAGLQGEARLWLVTQEGQAVGAGGGLSMAQSLLWGLSHVVALEHPALRCKRVDLDAAGEADAARLLLEELRADDGEDRVAYRGGVRHLARLVPGSALSLSDEDGSDDGPEFQGLFDSEGTYLITGGSGGLGRHVAAWMAAEGARHLLLVARRFGGPGEASFVEGIEARGVTVRLFAADVARPEQLAAAIRSIAPMHPLKGVVHAAGTLDDAPLLELDATRLPTVLGPKAVGAWNLHTLTRSCSLDMFVLFSSAASVLGSAGQGNYAAANAFLDALAHQRRRQGLPANSINWGPWSGGQGMSARLGPREAQRWLRAGIGFLSPRQGVEALGQILRRGMPPQIAVLPIEWERLAALDPGGSSPLFSDLVSSAASRGPGERSAPASGILRELTVLPFEERRPRLMEHLRVQAARVLGLPDSVPVDPTAALDELGLDSLMAIELRNALQESLGQPLPATLLYERTTLEALTEHLLALLSTERS